MTPRLAASVLVSAILRQTSAEGGFGAVLQRGDESAGAILIIVAERGEQRLLLERLLQGDASYRWQIASSLSDPNSLGAIVEKRRRTDPDLWLIELDVASAERFAAEMISQD